MSFVPGYEHDIFISYASVDDRPPVNVANGWVTTLLTELERVLAEELGRSGSANIWMDYQLGSNDVLTPTLLNAIDRSATLLVILSPGYMASEWCARERNAFLSRAREINAQGKGQIFLVEKKPIAWDDKPEEIRDIKGTPFWVKEKDRPHTLGDPTPRAEETDYYRRVNDLARDLADQLKRKAKAANEHRIEPAADTEQVLLAEVTDDLADKREEVRRYLQQQGIGVIDRYYPSNPVEYRSQLQADLQTSTVFVQLLSELAGRRPPGVDNGFPCLQFEIARTHDVRILQWHPTELSVDGMDEGPQKDLLLQPTVISEPFEQFKARVAEAARKQPDQDKPLSSESLVFLNYSNDDEDLALKIQDWVEAQGVGYVLPMTSGRPEENREALKTNVQESDAMMILHGKAAESWVRGQLLQFRKLKGGHKKGLAVFEGPPPDKPTVGMKLPGMQILDCRDNIDWNQIKGFLADCSLDTGNA